MRRRAPRRARSRFLRATASRIKAAITALLFCWAKALLNASFTWSGTLKFTVAISTSIVESFNNQCASKSTESQVCRRPLLAANEKTLVADSLEVAKTLDALVMLLVHHGRS